MHTFAQKRPQARQAKPKEGERAEAATEQQAVRRLDVDGAVQVAAGTGQPLPNETRRYFEPRFHYDFSKVRVHAGADAARGARTIQARAYTLGRDVVFGSGEYAPDTEPGKRLLAHELAHVVQQDGGSAADASIRREPKKPKKKKKKEFKGRPLDIDDVVKEMKGGLGGPYTGVEAWEKTIKPGKFLGHAIDGGSEPVKGIRPEFQALLTAAETKVNDEFKKSGTTAPAGFGIKSIGGYRRQVSPHGAGVAIDIDAGENPYISHQGDQDGSPQRLTLELNQVYEHIAQFMLNSPIDGEQSVVPKLIKSGDTLPKGQKNVSRRDRVAQYYDRLTMESQAMQKYFKLMLDDNALKDFLAKDWVTLHPKETAPAFDDIRKQMWQDFAELGGAIPKTGLPGLPDFKLRPDVSRPFDPNGNQRDPGAGFLTIPREVVLGLSQTVPRWGAIDFGTQSGDVMHFDDRYGLGKPFYDAKAPAQAKVDEENAKAKEEFDKAEADAEAKEQQGSGAAADPQQGSKAVEPQRKAILGAVDDPLEHEADAMADRVLGMKEPPAPDGAQALRSPRAGRMGVVQRKIRPEDVGKEMVGQPFRIREAFSDGTVTIPEGEVATVKSWDNASNTAEVTSPSAKDSYRVPKYLLEPAQAKVAGVSPYGAGLGKLESTVEKGAADIEAFKKTEPTYKSAKSKASFARDLNDKQTLQSSRESVLNQRLIQGEMLNRFDDSIKKWVDHYNGEFKFKGTDALDPNLIKAMVYQESQMGTFGDFMDDPPTNKILNRFNLLQAIDSWPEEQLPVMEEAAPDLIKKNHLENVRTDLIAAETELDTLVAKEKAGKMKAADTARLTELRAKSQKNWQPWFLDYPGFVDAVKEFLETKDGGKKREEDYDFWIRVGIRAVFEKHKSVKSWAEAARAYNGGGPHARAYRDAVVDRAEKAVKAEKDGKEFVPDRL